MASMRNSIEEKAREWSAKAWDTTARRSRLAIHRTTNAARTFLSQISTRNHRVIKNCRHRVVPLPLPSSWSPSTMQSCAGSCIIVSEVLEVVSDILMCRIHDTYKNLQFWKAREEGTDMQKVKFMILERGPLAFIDGVMKIVQDCFRERSATHGLVVTAVSRISKRTTLLSALQYRLAFVLGEVFKVAESFGDQMKDKETMQLVSEALLNLHKAILTLQGSYDLNQFNYTDEEVPGVTSIIVMKLEEVPEELLERKNWTDADVDICVNLIRENLARLDNFLASLMENYRKPRRATRHWLRYTGAAVGLALATGWVIRHSPLMGSHDIEIWLKKGGEGIAQFMKEHVEEPLMSIRDDLFETFRRRHRGAAELQDVHLTAESLKRMLKAFVEQSKGQSISDTTTDQELMEIVMNRYENEITRPLQNLIGGELFRAMLIQVQKLKLDIETAMLELNQILRANEINFAILAAFPAFLFAVILVWLLRISLLQSKGDEGKGRAARLRRRMLLAEVERMIMQCQIFTDHSQEIDAPDNYGMIIYLLNKFYRAVERHAIVSGEWTSLRQDIIDLTKPKNSLSHKLLIIARIERIYECIIPVPR